MGNQIPQASRDALAARTGGHCDVCGMRGVHYHHRRRRNVKTHDPHCACNALNLCAKCHERAHSHPDWAKARGIIVSPFIDNPGAIPIKTYQGWVALNCDGTVTYRKEPTP